MEAVVVAGMTREQGLEEQFERIMREYGAGMLRMASAYEGNLANRDDLVQEIALAVWKALPGFRGECSEKTLLYRIAHNRAVTHLWKRRRSPHPPGDEVEVADSRATPESQVSTDQLHRRLMAAIRQLAPARRQVMVMLLEDMTHAEIAAVLGITE